MANRKPLVNNAGEMAEIPAGDALQVASGGIRFSDNSLQTSAAAGGSPSTSTAQIDFGAGLHTSEVNLVVTGQTGISSTSVVRCNLEPVATSNHTVEDHRYAATFIAVTADTIVNGTGFTIRARTLYPMTGIFTVRWTWQ